MTADLPTEAITAALNARYGEPTDTYTWNRMALVVLEAAAPHIRADERERLARMGNDMDELAEFRKLVAAAVSAELSAAAAAEVRKPPRRRS